MRRLIKNSLISLLLFGSIWFLFGQAVLAGQSSQEQSKMEEIRIGKGKYAGKYWPTEGWRTCSPEEVGMDSDTLEDALIYASIPEYRTRSVVVIKNGYIVGEAYFGQITQDTTHESHSVAKSFTSALIGIAIDQGLIKSIDERVCQYYDEWDCNDQNDIRMTMTLKHLMTVTSGLDWQEDWTYGYKGRNNTLEMAREKNYLEYMLQRKPLYKPGTQFVYSTGDPMLLSGIIKKATGMSAFDYAQKFLFQKIGIPDITWSQDPAGNTITAWGIKATARDYAKFGYLFLNNGLWDGEQVVSSDWVKTSTRYQTGVQGWPVYGLLWHVNLPLRLQYSGFDISSDTNIPRDGYMAEGTGGQNIFIIPSKNLVIVRLASQRAEVLDEVDFLETIIGAIEE